jgi:hypothetical protein
MQDAAAAGNTDFADAASVGSKVVYAETATAAGGLDTDIVVNTPDGDTANGHVVLDGARLEAELTVAPLETPSYRWDGPYSY